jgi:hypothetical protein
VKPIDKHIYFPNKELVQKVENYRTINQINFSDAVCNLVEIALDNVEVLKTLNTINKNIDYLSKRQNYTYSLLKQFYSDFDTENITDPKKSKSLNEFLNKLNGRDIND